MESERGSVARRQRRSRIPEKPNVSLNVWSIMKNCIGKELSKIPLPVKEHAVVATHEIHFLKEWRPFSYAALI